MVFLELEWSLTYLFSNKHLTSLASLLHHLLCKNTMCRNFLALSKFLKVFRCRNTSSYFHQRCSFIIEFTRGQTRSCNSIVGPGHPVYRRPQFRLYTTQILNGLWASVFCLRWRVTCIIPDGHPDRMCF